MGLKLYPGSIKGQADSIIQNLEFDNKDFYYLHCKQFHNLYRIQNLKEQPGIA